MPDRTTREKRTARARLNTPGPPVFAESLADYSLSIPRFRQTDENANSVAAGVSFDRVVVIRLPVVDRPGVAGQVDDIRQCLYGLEPGPKGGLASCGMRFKPALDAFLAGRVRDRGVIGRSSR